MKDQMIRKCGCAETCANYSPIGSKEDKPRFEVGELVTVHDNKHLMRIEVIGDTICSLYDNIEYCNNGYSILVLSKLTIGAKFTTKCEQSIFPDGTGEFVVMDRKIPKREDLSTMRMYILDGNIISNYWCNSKRWIVLPSIDSGWWDKQIGDTGLWVRAYKQDSKLPVVMWSTSNGIINLWDINRYKSSFKDAVLDTINPPIIPMQLRKLEHNGEYKIPKGSDNGN